MELFDLEATNGECIADCGDTSTRLKLHCVEHLGDEYIKSKNYVCIWIPVDRKSFWSMIKEVCDRNEERTGVGDNAKREFGIISEHIDELMKQLEE